MRYRHAFFVAIEVVEAPFVFRERVRQETGKQDQHSLANKTRRSQVALLARVTAAIRALSVSFFLFHKVSLSIVLALAPSSDHLGSRSLSSSFLFPPFSCNMLWSWDVSCYRFSIATWRGVRSPWPSRRTRREPLAQRGSPRRAPSAWP